MPPSNEAIAPSRDARRQFRPTTTRINTKLTISYADIPDTMEAPAVIWIKPDGYAEALQTQVDTANKTMTAEVTHFSLYGGADTLLGFVFGLL